MIDQLKKVRSKVRSAERDLDKVAPSGDSVAIAYRLRELKSAVADYFNAVARALDVR
jgi:hypothetical protein